MTSDDRSPMSAEERDLEALFGAARASAGSAPDPALMARIEADALRLLPRPAPVARPGWGLAGLLDAVGGWPALGGLATAAAAGFWLGFASPEQLDVWMADSADAALLLPADYAGDLDLRGAAE